ncbi:hypothetical protein E2C01_043312 [Portunus trituberculatus]|uniref:Peptidase A2 domain-containing protein n=1 Tax=Portunus trituberculatus TaxID=210409 RepID=A0A5B7FVZ6_PORTR|nr:hypothetical protein [Portunus trituberculatus]
MAVVGGVEQYIEGEDFEAYTSRERIQRKLQEGDELTWDKACKLALSVETASTAAKLLAGGNREAHVNKVEPPRTAPRNRTRQLDSKGSEWCSRCGSNYKAPTTIIKAPPLVVNVQVEGKELNVQVEGKELKMEVDTGASNTVTSEVWSKLCSRPRLEASNKRLVTYTGERLQPIPEKTEAIRRLPAPTDVPTLRSLLGAVGYNSCLLLYPAATLTPLYALLKKGGKMDVDKRM